MIKRLHLDFIKTCLKIQVMPKNTPSKSPKITEKPDNFIAILAHELRNPLAPILNAIEILELQDLKDPQDQESKDAVAIIGRQARNITRLLDDLLDVSRLARGKIELQKESTDLALLVNHAIGTIRHFLESRRHILTVTFPAESIWVMADPVRVEQILVNLLTNAIKFTPRGGKVWLSIEKEGEMVMFRVRDSGMGISPEFLPKIFDLFAQVDQSLARTERGLGVGLAIVKALVEMHGGVVQAQSEGLGQGSEFIVRLPIAIKNQATPKSQILADLEEGTNKRVLVVDDNLDAANSLGRLLRRWGHEVKIVNDGVSVLQEAPQFKPDIILLDIGLPGMNGYEVAQKLRAGTVPKSTLIVAVTGYGQVEHMQKSQEAGFDYHFTKPLDFTRLKQVLGA